MGSSASLLSATQLHAMPGTTNSDKRDPAKPGKATACILLWMGGGMCHLDTLDPKRSGDAANGKPGSAYNSIPTAIDGV
ncbi:MAG: DUF1501 domain-containing protein, partial [Gimesia sp.]|nr:DUF1501 domain-containing protein [Gimesia sp.]